MPETIQTEELFKTICRYSCSSWAAVCWNITNAGLYFKTTIIQRSSTSYLVLMIGESN